MDRIIPHKYQRKIVGTIDEDSEFRLDYSDESYEYYTLQYNVVFSAWLDENNRIRSFTCSDVNINTENMGKEALDNLLNWILWNESNGSPLHIYNEDEITISFEDGTVRGIVTYVEWREDYWYIELTRSDDYEGDIYHWNQQEEGGRLVIIDWVDVML